MWLIYRDGAIHALAEIHSAVLNERGARRHRHEGQEGHTHEMLQGQRPRRLPQCPAFPCIYMSCCLDYFALIPLPTTQHDVAVIHAQKSRSCMEVPPPNRPHYTKGVNACNAIMTVV